MKNFALYILVIIVLLSLFNVTGDKQLEKLK